MRVLEYLNSFASKDAAICAIIDQYSILVREYDSGLVVLNYNQINSPKNDDITNECRGLILHYNGDRFKVVSRSFDRFYNYSECPETQSHLDMSKAIVYEKIDGSLIKIYHFEGKWRCSTRGTAYAESDCNGFCSFDQLVYNALNVGNGDEFSNLCDMALDPRLTYIFDITSRENRVVKRYDGYTLWFLAARDNLTGEYKSQEAIEHLDPLGVCFPRQFKFSSVEHCLEAARHLRGLDEGYVLYQGGVPVCKVKSPAYVAIHHLRGNGVPSTKRIMELVLMQEYGEYLSYFPEDRELFEPYIDGYRTLLDHIQLAWNSSKDCEDQKQFAMEVKNHPFSSCLFLARKKGISPIEAFHEAGESWKLKVLSGYCEGYV